MIYLVVQKPESDAVDDQYEYNEKAESEANGCDAAVTIAPRIDPESRPGQCHQQERRSVHFGGEEIHIGTERRRQLLARVRSYMYTAGVYRATDMNRTELTEME